MGRTKNNKGYVEGPPAPPALPAERLRIVPLGGVGEFGKNMMALEYGEDMILIDCGQMFPEDDMLGVDSVIPDFAYIDENLDKVRALVLTHGHEDHIGAIAYFMRDFDVPVYGSPITLAFVREKLKEMHIEGDCDLREINSGSKVTLGEFQLEFLQVNHSIPQSMSVAMTLPIGIVIHTGDYKGDCPEDNIPSDFQRFKELGDKGVLLLMSDSTNVDREGRTPSETSVREALTPIVKQATGTVILTAFSSALHRVQSVLKVAQETDRKVALAGFSMDRNFTIATKLGLLSYPEDLVVSLKDIAKFPRNRRLILCTGSQGETMSVLSRLALDDYRSYMIDVGDTVIFSTRFIPGNEKAIYRTINHLVRRGAHIVTDRDAPIHASGHACREEMRELYRLVRPKYLVPVHGEIRQLMGQKELAASVNVKDENIHILDNGDALDIGRDSVKRHRAGLAGQVLVDGKVMDELDEVVLRDRQHLSEDGMIICILVIDSRRRKICAGPDIVTRGFVEVDSNERLIERCKQVVIEAFESCKGESREEWQVVKTAVKKSLRKYLRDATDRYPLILPVIMEV